MKKLLIIVIILSFVISIFADDLTNDIINVKYQKKSLRKAALLSALFPGAGQFYADKSSITTYIFPVIEIGLIFGYFSYYNQGLDEEKKYEKWATNEIIGYEDDDSVNGAAIYRYSRTNQDLISNDLYQSTLENGYSFYENHFNLDDTDTQHFFEDIGKYRKYIFGWTDWFSIYGGYDGTSVNPLWRPFRDSDQGLKWSGNNPTDPESEYYQMDQELYDSKLGFYSGMRAEYNNKRKQAERYYSSADLFNIGIVFNHIVSALDAIRVTKKHNSEYIYGHNFQFNVKPVWVNNQICPSVQISQRF